MPFYLKRFSFLLLTFLLVMHVSTISASGNEGEKEKSFDIKEMIFSHVLDSYEWHLLTVGEKHISIPLLIIVKGEISYDDIGVSNYILKIANSAIVCSWINFASIWLHCFHLLSIVFLCRAIIIFFRTNYHRHKITSSQNIKYIIAQ